MPTDETPEERLRAEACRHLRDARASLTAALQALEMSGQSHPGTMRIIADAAASTRHGPIPDGLLVCHKCDVPACVNPAHLFAGTYEDKGRICRGEMRHSAKLTQQKVVEIRASTKSAAALARDHAVSETTIYKVRKRLSWAWVESPD